LSEPYYPASVPSRPASKSSRRARGQFSEMVIVSKVTRN